MTITPDFALYIKTSECSCCGGKLSVNDMAIFYDQMANGIELLIGTCCADRLLGSLIQDFADALDNRSFVWPSYWIRVPDEHRMIRIAEAAKNISAIYRDATKGLYYVQMRKGRQDTDA